MSNHGHGESEELTQWDLHNKVIVRVRSLPLSVRNCVHFQVMLHFLWLSYPKSKVLSCISERFLSQSQNIFAKNSWHCLIDSFKRLSMWFEVQENYDVATLVGKYKYLIRRTYLLAVQRCIRLRHGDSIGLQLHSGNLSFFAKHSSVVCVCLSANVCVCVCPPVCVLCTSRAEQETRSVDVCSSLREHPCV